MGEPDFLGPVDLNHARIMNHNLHDAEAYPAYLLRDQLQPVGWFHRFTQWRLHYMGDIELNIYYVNRDYIIFTKCYYC